MPLDPDIKAFLDEQAAQNVPKLWQIPVETARAARLELLADVERLPVGRINDHLVEGPGGPLALRSYHPTGHSAPGALAPLLVYLHGGGFVFGDLETSDPLSRRLCEETQSVVVSVDYRLAPEHPYPAAVEDAVAAVRWSFANASQLGTDPNRVVIAGDSAGGSLAITAALAAIRDSAGSGSSPEPAKSAASGLVLVYPVTDMRDLPYDSRSEYADGYGLSAADMEWFYQQYIGEQRYVVDQPWASPMIIEDLSGLPPTLLLSAEYDPLRSEAEAFAERLEAQGVAVDYGCVNGMNHGALTNAEGFAAGRRLRSRIVTWINDLVH